MYACILETGRGFFEGVCGRRIDNTFSVTHPSSPREPQLDWSRTVGRKPGTGSVILPIYKTYLTTLIS
jgi:hypothetical protein